MKNIKTFAEAVGIKIKTVDGFFHLYQSGEIACICNSHFQILESLQVYAGSHPNYKEAAADYKASGQWPHIN